MKNSFVACIFRGTQSNVLNAEILYVFTFNKYVVFRFFFFYLFIYHTDYHKLWIVVNIN